MLNLPLLRGAARPSFALIAAAVLATACATDSDLSRFDQSWEGPLEEVTCEEWSADMQSGQRFAAAAEWLLAERGGAPGFPSDGQFTYYMSRISDACEAASEEMAREVATDVYAEHEAQLSEPAE